MFRTFAILILSIITFNAAAAQAPEIVSYQGHVTDPSGLPINGTFQMKFRLVRSGDLAWVETHPSVNVSDGIFNVSLGANTPLDTLAFDSPLLIGTKLGTDPWMTPQQPLRAVPYALGMRGIHSRWLDLGGGTSGYNIVAGSSQNTVGSETVGATIGGGGGMWNYSVVDNTAKGDFSTVAGGAANEVDGDYGAVSGGFDCKALSEGTAVGGGYNNAASGNYSTVAGGYVNRAYGASSIVVGGIHNMAIGRGSLAAGRWTRARHDGTFVWQDATAISASDTLWTSTANQFAARASGGFWFFTDPAPSVATGVFVGSGSGTWNTLSSKESKSNFRRISPGDYLEKLAGLELSEWSYKTEDGVTHVGPMAEDFFAAFGLGPDDRSISTVDADGVALAAIQGLYDLVKELQADNERMRTAIEKCLEVRSSDNLSGPIEGSHGLDHGQDIVTRHARTHTSSE